jgi:uncharacterized protein (TIGR03000 family)
MDSLSLMAALSAGVDSAPAWWHCGCHGGCYGCCSCSYWGGCCSCYDCYGCCSCFSGYACNGYYGCCGYCGGYCGGCGCCGYGGCCGGYGCCGYGGWCGGCCGCYGMCYTPYACHGCYGCCGCMSCCSGGWSGGYCWGPGSYHPYPLDTFAPAGPVVPGVQGVMPGTPGVPGGVVPGTPGTPGTGGEPVPPPMPPKKEGDKKEGEVSTRAKLVVEVPADARLYIDDQLMKTTSSKRVFSTPFLAQGQAYYYEVRVEVLRDGKPVSETKKVVVRAGEEARASFPNLEPATVTAQADR